MRIKSKKRIIANKKNTIKRIRIKFERLKNHKRMKIKIIYNIIYYLLLKKIEVKQKKIIELESNLKKNKKTKFKKR